MVPLAGFLPTLTVGCEWFCGSSLWFLGPSIRKAHQTCTGTNKTKKTKPQQLVRKHGHRFGFFVVLVFWVPVQVW